MCFEERLGTEVGAYVAIELDEHYGKLIRYIREAEPLAAKVRTAAVHGLALAPKP